MNFGLPSTPFVLIDDARPDRLRPARLYCDPVGEVRADQLDEVVPTLMKLKDAGACGLHAAGFIGYEAGYALEGRLRDLDPRRSDGDPPLLWFGLFARREDLDTQKMFDSGRAEPIRIKPCMTYSEYGAAFASVQERIVAGDVYQINLTFPSDVGAVGDPAGLYAALRPHAEAGHGALMFTGSHWMLSFSPEQFFALEGDRLTTRPMKGTAPRNADPIQDAANARALLDDPKQRAENLMIVDLLRNDLSRIALPGSVEVPELFTIETYPTVHQMTSTVTARLKPGLDAVDALVALFPCGSITGAPKIRAMEIIHEVERFARGVYTGAIGAIDSSGNAAFNVAIRTICVNNGEARGTIGLGSGVVADSEVMSEWRECLEKARFLSPDAAEIADDRT